MIVLYRKSLIATHDLQKTGIVEPRLFRHLCPKQYNVFLIFILTHTKITIILAVWIIKGPDNQGCIFSRCIPTDEAINTSLIHTGCHDFIADSYVYMFLSDYSCLNDILERLHVAFQSSTVSEVCNQTIRGYFCNYVYPSCEPASTNGSSRPLGICQEDCLMYLLGENCKNEIAFLSNLGDSTGEFSFPLQCENTLMFLLDLGLEFDTTQEQSDDCVDLSGKLC